MSAEEKARGGAQEEDEEATDNEEDDPPGAVVGRRAGEPDNVARGRDGDLDALRQGLPRVVSIARCRPQRVVALGTLDGDVLARRSANVARSLLADPVYSPWISVCFHELLYAMSVVLHR